MLLLTLTLNACGPRPIVGPTTPPRPATMPTYTELVDRYNARLTHLTTLWARANIKAFFRDDRGRFHTETGEDSVLMFELPHGVAMSIGKLGKTGLWAGGNEETYWLFDVQNEQTVWFGRHENLGKATTQPLPLPIHPLGLLTLLGVQPIDPALVPDESIGPAVEWVDGAFLIEPPGMNARFLLDAQTAVPLRIDLTDERGESVLIAHLRGAMPVQSAQVPRDQWPTIADRVVVRVVGRDGELTLRLNDASDGQGEPRTRRALQNAFNFAHLIHALRPQQAVNLDVPEPSPPR